jgi:ADP-sugar diphosphatase
MDISFTQPLSPERQAQVLGSSKVRRWLAAIRAAFDVSSVTFDAAYFFGPNTGYVMARAEATLAGRRVPGLALIRGGSVGVKLDLITPDGKRHTVLTVQPRLPIGDAASVEILAGMVDEGVFRSKALDEISEEIGEDISVAAEDLVPLAAFHPSPGGCDETIHLCLVEKHVTHDLIRSLEGRQTGAPGENEAITVMVVDNDELPVVAAADGKSLLAYYTHMAQMGLVARPAIGTRVEDSPAAQPPLH